LTFEIGCGGGEHLATLAAQEPDHEYWGAEPFINGVVSLMQHIQRLSLTNVRLYPQDVRMLLPTLPQGCCDRLIVLFADPWPKERHHRRRLIQAPFLREAVRLLKPGGELRIATDHDDYKHWILDHLKQVPQLEPQFSWADLPTTRPSHWPGTRYEAKALAQGHSCIYLTLRRVL
jgi:tRNA (guanine-N7-)-methyltransferase